jgi:hypothetical protein
VEALEEGCLGIMVEGVPAELVRNLVEAFRVEFRGPRGVFERGEGYVRGRWEDTVEKGLLIVDSGRGEGAAGELLGV